MGVPGTGRKIDKSCLLVTAILITVVSIWGPLGCGKKSPTAPPTPSARSCAAHTGDNQTAQVGTAVPNPPAVIVRDKNGNPFAGTSVTFAVQSGGGTITKGTVVTGADGIATVGSWTLGPTAGVNTLQATAPTSRAVRSRSPPPGPPAPRQVRSRCRWVTTRPRRPGQPFPLPPA